MSNILKEDNNKIINDFSNNLINNNIDNVFKLPSKELIDFLNKAPVYVIMKIINNQEKLLTINDNSFRIIFLYSNDFIKKEILKNELLYKKIVLFPKNTNGKNLFDLVSDEIKITILDYSDRLTQIDKSLFLDLLKKLPQNIFDNYTNNLDISLFMNSLDDLKYYIVGKYQIDNFKADDFFNKVNNKSRNIYSLLKIDNYTQFNIFNKYNLITNGKYEGNNIILSNGQIIKKDIIENINERHLNLLIEQLKSKDSTANDEMILISAINLYCLFGYSHALTIIKDKFTYINEQALTRAAKTSFTEVKRQYRLEHQDRFFSNNMIDEVLISLRDNNQEFFKNVCLKSDNDYISLFINKLNMNLGELNKTEKRTFIADYMQKEIKERENQFEKEYIEKYFSEYYKNNGPRRLALTTKEIYNYFKNININNISLNEKGQVIVNDDLVTLLLGNAKNNNDCLLRLIFNNTALDLNKTYDHIINNFDQIKGIIDNSKGFLSSNSILDIINVGKVLLYELAPNEQDLTLDTVAKIWRSHKYVEEAPEDIWLRAKTLNIKKKEKVSSTIPYVSNTIKNGIRYTVLNFDYPKLLTCGIDSQSCLKIGGKGEDFLKYCLTNSNAVIVGLWDENKQFYTCPFVRHGNGLYGNGIEPKPESEDNAKKILEAIQECAEKIIEKSDKAEKIEFVTITDLKQQDFFEKQDIPAFENEIHLPTDVEKIYTDYFKTEITHYVLASTRNFIPTYYKANIKYFQDRIPNYVYNIDCEEDKQIIQTQINSICYSSIDYKNISNEEKNRQKRQYKNLNINNFLHVIGNKDWFIAIDENTNIISCCLPYDPRAKKDYLNAFGSIKKQFYNKKIGEKKI